MDKKILSTAIAGVLAGSMAFAANADVTLYGRVDLSIDAVDIDGANNDANMNSNNSRLGVKGSEDLGNGLKAIFQLEYGSDVSGSDTAAGGLTTGRDQWVGLSGDFGKARFGTASTRYKELSKKVDPLWDTSLEGRNHGLQSKLHGGDGSNGEGRMTNGIFFHSADYNGLELGVSYSLDDTCTPPSCAPGASDDDAYSLGASYTNGPMYLFTSMVTSSKGGDDSATEVGGKYSFGDFGIYGMYELDGGLLAGDVNTPNQNNDGADVWNLGGSYNMGNMMLYAGYGQGSDDSSNAQDTGYDAWTVGGTYNFSKRTMVYTGYNLVSCDTGGWSNTATNQCANVSASGGDNTLFSAGMRHNF